VKRRAGDLRDRSRAFGRKAATMRSVRSVGSDIFDILPGSLENALGYACGVGSGG